MVECNLCNSIKIYRKNGFSYEEALKLAKEQLVEMDNYSKTISEWIKCCMEKHGPKGDKTMTHEQCVAAAHKSVGKSK